IDGWNVAPSSQENVSKERQLARLKAHSTLSESLAKGGAFGTSNIEAARALIDASFQSEVVSIGLTLCAQPNQEENSRALQEMAYQRSSEPAVAWAEFAQVGDRDLIIAAAEEYYPTAIDSLGREALPLLERSNESGETQRWSQKAVLRTAESA